MYIMDNSYPQAFSVGAAAGARGAPGGNTGMSSRIYMEDYARLWEIPENMGDASAAIAHPVHHAIGVVADQERTVVGECKST